MPRKERNAKSATKALAEVAAKPGQAKITSLFTSATKKTSHGSEQVEVNVNPASVLEQSFDTTENTQNSDQSRVGLESRNEIDQSFGFVEAVFVRCEDDFTGKDKEKSAKNGRYFQREWFKQHTWLAYSRELNKAFCSICATCTGYTAKQKGVFGGYEFGFSNWKKGPEEFKEHEESVCHKAACAATIPKVGGQCSIDSVCNTINLSTQQLRRQGLISHLQTLKTLLRQGVAIRGNTDCESNVYQFDLDKAINDRGLKLLLDENRYVTAHDILEEQKRELVLRAGRYLLDEILSKKFFSILADESSDISKKEQLSFSVRTCNDDYEVSEDFVGIFDCSQGLSSEALLRYTKDILLRCGMDGKRMAAMGFDGAAAMKPLARMLHADVAPNAIYVHCFAHCNELIVKDATKQSDLLSTSLDLCQSLYAIVGAYPKRILLFEEIQRDFLSEGDSKDYKVLRLQSLSATRWTTRVKAVDVIFEKTTELRKTLETLEVDPSVTADTKARIRGILRRQLCSLEVIFGLNGTRKLVGLLEKLSKELQAVDISAEYALFSIRHVIRRFQEMRCEEEFQSLLEEAKKIPDVSETSEPVRQRKISRWMADGETIVTERLRGRDDNVHDSNTAKMRRSYYEAIDAILTSLSDRFEQEELTLLSTIEKILLTATKKRKVSLAGLTTSLVNKENLAKQLEDLPTIVSLYNTEQKKKISEITRIATIAQIFNAIPAAKKQCSEVHQLTMLYYTVPLASASCERTFSAMRRLKTWLRSKAGGNHLNDIMFANIQRRHMDMVDIDVVAKEFAERNERRIAYFGKYYYK